MIERIIKRQTLNTKAVISLHIAGAGERFYRSSQFSAPSMAVWLSSVFL